MPGKTVSPRLKEIEDNFVKDGGSFKEFRIGDLFEVTGTKSIDAGKLTFSNHGINFIGRTGEFNGIQGKVERLDFAPNPANTITVAVIGYKYVKYQEEPYYCSQNINKLTPKFELNHLRALWLMSGINKFVGQYNGQYSGYKLEQLKNAILYIPVHSNNRIAFDYMENFIRELEMERIRELDAYLKATGLNDTELTDEEKDCLEKFEKGEICLKEFRIGELFEIRTGSLVPSQKLKKGSIPRVSVMSSNNGIIDYCGTENCEEARHFSNFISVNFLGNCFYHPYKASLEMKVHVLRIPKHPYTDATGLYVTSALNRVLNGNYSYGEQLSSSDLKNQNIYISLPVHDNRITFDTMETFIRALEKLCVRSVVTWKDKIIKTTKRVVNKNAPSDV